jgi:hypothetical protein
MKGVARKTDMGWFVESFTISDRPPFFEEKEFPVRPKQCAGLEEDMDVEFIIEMEITPISIDYYAALKKTIQYVKTKSCTKHFKI